jgi:hypothetical protein
MRGLTEIMYAAYQLHDWLKTVKIARVYLVQRLRLTGDCCCKTESRNDFIILAFQSEKICLRQTFFVPKSCIQSSQAGRILRHHYVTSVVTLTALICTNPLTKEG